MENKIKTTPAEQQKSEKIPWYANLEIKDLFHPITLRRIRLLQGIGIVVLLATVGYVSWKYFYAPPTGQQLVQEMVAASGGMEAWNNIQGGQFTRTRRIFNESGNQLQKSVETFYFKKASDGLKLMVKSVSEDGKETWVGKDDEGYWATEEDEMVDPKQAAHDKGMMCDSKWCEPLCASSMAFYRFSMPFKLMDDGVIPRNAGNVLLNGQEAIMLDVTYNPEVGRDRWVFYVSPKTKLIQKLEYHNTADSGESRPEEIYWSEHAPEAGLTVSHKWTRYGSNGKATEETTFSAMDFKTKIADDFFHRPVQSAIGYQHVNQR